MAKVDKKHKRLLVAPPAGLRIPKATADLLRALAAHDRDAALSAVWMPLREAVARAGTLEALLPALSDGRIRARAAGFYSGPNGGAVTRHNPTPLTPYFKTSH
jgi:hypothetical protein